MKLINSLRGIIQDMASFRNMRKMVAMLDDLNDERVLSDDANVEADGEYYPSLADKETVINHYVKLGHSDKPRARKIYRDLTSGRYGYVREVSGGSGRRIDVTAAGGDLIKEFTIYPYGLTVYWGMWLEILEKNYKAITLFLTFISGVVIGVFGVILT